MSVKCFMRKYLGKVAFKQILVFFIVVIYTMGNLFSPLLFSFIIDNVINQKEITSSLFIFISEKLGGILHLQQNLWIVATMLLAVNILVGLCIFFRGKLNSEIAQNMTENLRNDLYSHIQLWPYSVLSKAKTGDLIQRCTSDVETIRSFFSGQLAEIVYAVTITITANIILFSIDSKLALYSLFMLPIIFVISMYFFNKIQKYFVLYDDTESELTTITQENLANLRVVRAFNREKYEFEKFDKKNKELSKIDFDWINQLGIQWGIGGSLSMAQVLLTILIGIYEVVNGNITIGQFSVFISYEGMIIYPVRSLARLLANMGKMRVAVSRLLEIFNEKTEDLESGKVFDIKGNIIFDHVGFQ